MSAPVSHAPASAHPADRPISASLAGPLPAGAAATRRMAIIIVHYRTPGLLRECIDSVHAEIDPSKDEIVVVDNASNDGSIETLRQFQGVTLIESSANLGFAGANNLGIRAIHERGGAEFYMLLNPDTVVRPGAFGTLLNYLQAHPEAAMVGPRLEHRDGTPQLSAFQDHTPIGEFVRGASIGPINRLLRRWDVVGPVQEVPHRADWIAGACLLIRRQVLEQVGLLDPGYFMYYEEADFCRRARRAGYPTWYVPEAHVVHLVGQASGVVNAKQMKRLPAYWFESRHRYFRKNFGYLGAVSADILWLAGHSLMRVRRLFTGVSHAALAACEARDFVRHEARQLVARLPRPT